MNPKYSKSPTLRDGYDGLDAGSGPDTAKTASADKTVTVWSAGVITKTETQKRLAALLSRKFVATIVIAVGLMILCGQSTLDVAAFSKLLLALIAAFFGTNLWQKNLDAKKTAAEKAGVA